MTSDPVHNAMHIATVYLCDSTTKQRKRLFLIVNLLIPYNPFEIKMEAFFAIKWQITFYGDLQPDFNVIAQNLVYLHKNHISDISLCPSCPLQLFPWIPRIFFTKFSRVSYSQERCDPRPLEKQRQALKGRATGTMLSEFSLIIFTHQKMLKLFKNPEKTKQIQTWFAPSMLAAQRRLQLIWLSARKSIT